MVADHQGAWDQEVGIFAGWFKAALPAFGVDRRSLLRWDFILLATRGADFAAFLHQAGVRPASRSVVELKCSRGAYLLRSVPDSAPPGAHASTGGAMSGPCPFRPAL